MTKRGHIWSCRCRRVPSKRNNVAQCHTTRLSACHINMNYVQHCRKRRSGNRQYTALYRFQTNHVCLYMMFWMQCRGRDSWYKTVYGVTHPLSRKVLRQTFLAVPLPFSLLPERGIFLNGDFLKDMTCHKIVATEWTWTGHTVQSNVFCQFL